MENNPSYYEMNNTGYLTIFDKLFAICTPPLILNRPIPSYYEEGNTAYIDNGFHIIRTIIPGPTVLGLRKFVPFDTVKTPYYGQHIMFVRDHDV